MSVTSKSIRRTKLSQITDEQFKQYALESSTMHELVEKCGYDKKRCSSGKRASRGSLTASKFYARLKELNIDPPRLGLKPVNNLVLKRRNPKVLRRKLESAGVLEICAWCRCEHMTLEDGQWFWYGKPLRLHIDHIHGRSDPPKEEDDNVSNLRFMCWNCHTQTPTCKMGYKVNPKPSTPWAKSRRILRLSEKEYKCEMCKCEHMEKGFNGAWEWRDWMLNLQCDHIDGDRSNNDISNMRWLCPNCHSTTDTYSGRNRKRKREEDPPQC